MRTLMTFVAMQLLFVANVCASLADKPNLKFGNPTKEELEMRTYELDTSATAVVLCSLTNTYYQFDSNGLSVIYEVKKRVKVLKPEGTDVANVEIRYFCPAKARGVKESISGLKATAWNVEDGKVQKVKMESGMVFDERVDKQHMLMKFTIPQVKPGTVIEYEYKKTSDLYMQVDDWYAQSSIPTAYAFYKVEIPSFFTFNTETSGYYPLEGKKRAGDMNLQILGESWSTDVYEYVGRNLPAVKDASYCWCASQYSDRVTMEMSHFLIPGFQQLNYASTWDDVDKMLISDDDFGGRMRRANPLRDEMKAAGIAELPDFDSKLDATCKLLMSRVKWNKKYSLYGSSAHDILSNGTGSNADINFLLINMLRDLDINAKPVLLRLRSDGRLPFTYPSINNINTFVVGIAKNDSTIVYFDGSAEHGYPNVLPAELLSVGHPMNGLCSSSVLDVSESVDSHVRISVVSSISSDKGLTSSVVCKSGGLESMDTKDGFYEAKDSADYVRRLGEAYGMSVDKYSCAQMREYSPQVVETFELSKELEGSDVLYISPMELFPIRENPFVAEERSLPVDFDSRQNITYKYTLHIPEGYTVEELPKSVSLKNDDGSLVCRFISRQSADTVEFVMSFSVRKTLFVLEEYKSLKATYDEVGKLVNSVLVLKKL